MVVGYIIKKLYQSLFSYMSYNWLGIAHLVGYQLIYNSTSWYNCKLYNRVDTSLANGFGALNTIASRASIYFVDLPRANLALSEITLRVATPKLGLRVFSNFALRNHVIWVTLTMRTLSSGLVFLLPQDEMLVHRKITLRSKFARIHLYTWVKRGTDGQHFDGHFLLYTPTSLGWRNGCESEGSCRRRQRSVPTKE